MIIPLDGEKLTLDDGQLLHILNKKLTNEEFIHQSSLAKVGYKIFEVGSKTLLRIDLILQAVPLKMKQSMVKDVLDELMQVFFNVDLQSFKHILGNTVSNDPFVISQSLKMMPFCNLVLNEPTSLENIDDAIVTIHNTWHARLGEQPFIEGKRQAFEMGLDQKLIARDPFVI